MDNNRLFTPFISATCTVHAHMMLDSLDQTRFDAIPKDSDQVITVTDQHSGHNVNVARADCGLGCRCAAVIVEVINA